MALPQAPNEHRFCIIIGAGLSGVIQGAEFLRSKTLPLEEFEILDRNGSFGGVWWKNTYPGAACDIPSHLYSVSWAPNPNWGQRFAPQPEIQKYYEDIAISYGLDKSTTFNTEVEQAYWDDSRLLWVLETKNLVTGTKTVWTTNLLISAAGQFSVPKKLDIPGRDTFQGEEWHTVSWPKGFSLKNKRVGVIGTGPSAAQLIPKIHKDAASLVVYQRSPSFCIPRQDYAFSAFTKWIFAKVPLIMYIYKSFLYKQSELLSRHVFRPGTWWQKKAIQLAWRHLDAQVKDPIVREKLRPHDNFGCKRPLVLDDYYPVFNDQNVELVTDPVVGLTENGIVSNNAKAGEEERKVDVLIWGTGYRNAEFGLAYPARGRSGTLLSDKYLPRLATLYGVAIDDFPNFLTFLGPNSLSFEASLVEEVEWQSKFNVQIAEYLLKKNKGSFSYAIVPKAERVVSWTESLRDGQEKHPANVPSCESYYKSKTGIIYFWPYKIEKYHKLIQKPDFKNDWLLLSNRAGQKAVKITDVD